MDAKTADSPVVVVVADTDRLVVVALVRVALVLVRLVKSAERAESRFEKKAVEDALVSVALVTLKLEPENPGAEIEPEIERLVIVALVTVALPARRLLTNVVVAKVFEA